MRVSSACIGRGSSQPSLAVDTHPGIHYTCQPGLVSTIMYCHYHLWVSDFVVAGIGANSLLVIINQTMDSWHWNSVKYSPLSFCSFIYVLVALGICESVRLTLSLATEYFHIDINIAGDQQSQDTCKPVTAVKGFQWFWQFSEVICNFDFFGQKSHAHRLPHYCLVCNILWPCLWFSVWKYRRTVLCKTTFLDRRKLIPTLAALHGCGLLC